VNREREKKREREMNRWKEEGKRDQLNAGLQKNFFCE
jgi:hypothetical protein